MSTDLLGKKKLLAKLRAEADELRSWMLDNTSPDVSADEFCKVANAYAILCTRIAVIEKQW